MDNDYTNRKLAAILAADVVGYSRLMAEDEVGTLAALNRHRKNRFNPAVDNHRGRIVKLIGDGTLVEFASVVDAVNCAIAIQHSMPEDDSGPDIPLRIGINLGDVITQGDDIYGDGVNIAARLEALAQPGGVCISSVVEESIRGRTKTEFIDGGEVVVENIDRPVKVWHWHPESASNTDDRKLDAAKTMAEQNTPEKPSIAVL